MSKWLASVQSLEEAQKLSGSLPDILDIKKPSQGALGALSITEVTEIVSFISSRCQTSATVGDLPMQANRINEAMAAMAVSGVDYVKVGLFPDQNLINCLNAMKMTIETLNVPVIAVLFADNWPEQTVMPLLKAVGFHGVMVDTAVKDGQHLLNHWQDQKLVAFVESVQQQGLICGLAGALRLQDIFTLQQFGADYLGFRSALCEAQQRTTTLKVDLAIKVQQAIQHGQPLKKAM